MAEARTDAADSARDVHTPKPGLDKFFTLCAGSELINGTPSPPSRKVTPSKRLSGKRTVEARENNGCAGENGVTEAEKEAMEAKSPGRGKGRGRGRGAVRGKRSKAPS